MIISKDEYNKNFYMTNEYGDYETYLASLKGDPNLLLAQDYEDYFIKNLENIVSSSFGIYLNDNVMKIFLIIDIDGLKYNVNILITITSSKFQADCGAYMSPLDKNNFESLYCRSLRSKIKTREYIRRLSEAINLEHDIQIGDADDSD